MGNNIWSENIQGILNLDLSREMRFRDDRKELFLYLLGLKEGMTVADIGCGPGAITRKLSKWLGGKSKIIGIDRDTNFISYAREEAERQGLYNISYYEGDALKLPLEDDSVDACISHTVIEHVSNSEFLLEQKRVCKAGGRVSVMYAVPDKYIKTEPDSLPGVSNREAELMEKLFKGTGEIKKGYNIGKFWPDPVKLPELFGSLGFKNVQVDGIAIPMVIDDSRNSNNQKATMIEAERQQLLEQIDIGMHLNKNRLTDKEAVELKRLISDRFLQRLNYIKHGRSIWDYSILIIQIVSGEA